MTTTDKKLKLAGNRTLARRHSLTEGYTLGEIPARKLKKGDRVVSADRFDTTQILAVESVQTYTHSHVLIKFQHPYFQTVRTRNSPVLVEVAS